MDFENFKNSIDYRNNLLFGLPIKWDGIKIYPIKLKDLINYSLDKYNKFVSIITLNKTEIMESLNILEEVSLWDFIILNFVSVDNDEIRDLFLHILSLCFRDIVRFSIEGYFLIGDSGKTLNENNFMQIISILRDQNQTRERKEKFVNKKEREYFQAVQKAKQKYQKALKAMGKDDTDLLDIISSICAKHPSLNFSNIQELTIYQLIDQFKRINMIDDYFISIDSLLAGASKKNVDLKHWSKKYE